ncbi:MAG: DnaD domain protein [Chloroflexi bacterium]|nr:DnaD domain protein [Chloroflexota bacterium]
MADGGLLFAIGHRPSAICQMTRFAGFPSGKVRVTPLPDLFFGDLLAQIDDLAELKVTLYIFWRLAHQKAPFCVRLTELRADPSLGSSLALSRRDVPSKRSLDDALRRAVERGTLLTLRTKNRAGQVEHWYFGNNEMGRREWERVRRGELKLRRGAAVMPQSARPDRPNAFSLYERYIGMLTPMVAEQVQEAAQTYAPQWVAEAFEIAAKQDKRNWRYVYAILQGWAREGKRSARDYPAPPAKSAPTLPLKRKPKA